MKPDIDPKIWLDHYKPEDIRTWAYYPIIMPLKDGYGPAETNNCDEIVWEVWDVLCESHGSFKCLPDAINKAILLNDLFWKEAIK